MDGSPEKGESFPSPAKPCANAMRSANGSGERRITGGDPP